MISRLSCFRANGREDCFLPYRNLAIEKYLTFHVPENECILYLWQNRRTVVIGRNQNPWKECNIEKLIEDGGYLVRRLSGGGAVYHDLGNLNFTFCVRKKDYDVSRQLEVILRAVRSLGIPAEKTGRNDLTAEGRKFSGNAFYESGDFCYHHGTIMMDVDSAALERYLRVSAEKLRGKGVDSVRSRVVNLKEYRSDLTAELLSERLKSAFSEVYGLPVSNVGEVLDKEIRKDTAFFASRDWNYGRNMPFTNSVSGRFDWGGIEILLKVNRGRVEDVMCHSDAMDPDFAGRLSECLIGCEYNRAALARAAAGCPAETETARQMVEDVRELLLG